MKRFFDEYYFTDSIKWPHKNLWLGVTAENQEQTEKRIPILLQIPVAVRFVSAEPLLGPLNIRPGLPREPKLSLSVGTQNSKGLDWVICGGESGPHSRPFDIDWAYKLLVQCKMAKVPFFFKQVKIDGKMIKTPELNGKKYLEIPKF